MPARSRLPRRLPLLFSLGVMALFLVTLVVGTGVGTQLAGKGGASDEVASAWGDVIGETVAAAALLGLVALLRCRRQVGLTAPSTWREPRLAWIPAVYVPIALLTNTGQLELDVARAVPDALSQLLTGFGEELAFRGLILAALLVAWRTRPSRVRAAVLVSSLLFSLFHAVNLLSGAPVLDTAAQLVYTFGLGALLAAVRLRTGTIWLVALVHGLIDVAGSTFVDPDAGNGALTLTAVAVGGLVFGWIGLRLLPGVGRADLVADGLDDEPVDGVLLDAPGRQ